MGGRKPQTAQLPSASAPDQSAAAGLARANDRRGGVFRTRWVSWISTSTKPTSASERSSCAVSVLLRRSRSLRHGRRGSLLAVAPTAYGDRDARHLRHAGGHGLSGGVRYGLI